MFKSLRIASVSLSTYYAMQKYYLYPSIMKLWKAEENYNLTICAGAENGIAIGGDARCDSPGHNAKYGSYSVMDMQSNKILTFQLIQSNEVKNSNAMELEGFKRCMTLLESHNITVRKVVTDRHVQIKKYIREKRPEIVHEFDAWHLVKPVNKKLAKASLVEGCENIQNWARSISNHLYFCASFSVTNQEKVDKWLSLPNHISNIHKNHSGELFPECTHPPITRRALRKRKKTWIKTGTLPHLKVSQIVENKLFLKDVAMMSDSGETSALEGFHSTILHFAPKNTHFFYEGMQSRIALAAMHHNENCQKGLKYNEDEVQCSIKFPKAKKGEAVLSFKKEESTYNYVQKLFEEVLHMRQVYKTYDEVAKNLEKSVIPPPLAHSFENPTRKI